MFMIFFLNLNSTLKSNFYLVSFPIGHHCYQKFSINIETHLYHFFIWHYNYSTPLAVFHLLDLGQLSTSIQIDLLFLDIAQYSIRWWIITYCPGQNFLMPLVHSQWAGRPQGSEPTLLHLHNTFAEGGNRWMAAKVTAGMDQN